MESLEEKDETLSNNEDEDLLRIPRKRTLKRRKLNLSATLNAYEQRIRAFSHADLMELNDHWLSSYDVWDTIEKEKVPEEIEKRFGTEIDNNVFRLFKVATEKQINILGVTSERQCGGMYVAEIPVEGGRAASNVFYVGVHNSFQRRSVSKFSIIPRDKRYFQETK